MTIKQQGGIFGRNPSFNDVEANEINIGDGASGGSINISKDESGGFTAIVLRNESTASNILKHSGITFRGTDTIGTNKPSAFIRSYPEDGNYVNASLSFSTRSGDVTAEKARLTSAGNLKFINAGNGIDFSATSGTGTSELFDDYEEGQAGGITLTPSTSGSFTANATLNTLAYTKVGRLVSITGMIGVTASSPVGTFVELNGLPFAAADLGETSGRFSGVASFNGSPGNPISVGYALEGWTKIRFPIDASTVTGNIYVNVNYIAA